MGNQKRLKNIIENAQHKGAVTELLFTDYAWLVKQVVLLNDALNQVEVTQSRNERLDKKINSYEEALMFYAKEHTYNNFFDLEEDTGEVAEEVLGLEQTHENKC